MEQWEIHLILEVSMTDFLTKEARSLLMSKIKGKNTRMEVKFFALLKEAGFRFRKYPKKIFGNPDAANKSAKIAFFYDSAFWHGYDWKNRKQRLRSNKKFWIAKIERNIARDREVNRSLKKNGWRVVRVWEHELGKKSREKTIRKLQRVFNG